MPPALVEFSGDGDTFLCTAKHPSGLISDIEWSGRTGTFILGPFTESICQLLLVTTVDSVNMARSGQVPLLPPAGHVAPGRLTM